MVAQSAKDEGRGGMRVLLAVDDSGFVEDLLRAAELRRAGFAAQTGVRIGDATDTILGQATEWGADLIAVGSHGQRSIHDFLLGSVAESVARRAGCSVAIIRNTVKS